MTQRVSKHKGRDNLFARSLLCAAGAAEVAKAFDVTAQWVRMKSFRFQAKKIFLR